MPPSIRNGNTNYTLWVRHPDGNINLINPGALIVPNNMVPGCYEIASVEIVPAPIPHHPPGTKIYVTNVGQETIVFISPKHVNSNFILPSQQSKELADDEFVIHIPSVSISSTLYDNLILHDAREAAPDGFIHTHHLPHDRVIDLEIGLRGCDAPGLVKRLYEVSTPGGPSYGKHLSKEEAESYVSPTDETVREINAWLAHHGVESKYISPSGNRLQITLPVSKANNMFQATFSAFRHTGTGHESFHTLSYSLPSEVKHMIESVEPTTSFPNPASRHAVQAFANESNSDVLPSGEVLITPDRLTQLYGIPTAKITQTRNVLSVPGFDNEYANYEDLAMFLDKYRPDLVGASFTSQSIDGGLNIQSRDSAGGEANLDIQYTVGLVNFTPVDFISSGMNSINGFIRLVHHWLDQDNPPTVVSISYGFNEHILSTQSTGILCTLFAQLGARGVSVLVSSGDGGVAGSQAPEETPHDFIPTFPAGCPFVTAVGATKGFPTEIAAPLSAGGFSNYFERPSYQAAAVKDYLDQIGSLYNDRFNPTGRAFPDISAQGDNIAIVINQKQDVTGGTSASTPIVASTIALLNDRLIQKGKKPLGFLNPWLYANQGVFNDIISGSNPGCGTNGFPAKVGWDPVTGLGTPNFAKMAKALDV